MNAPTAVFDLDGTITKGDLYLAFLIDGLLRRPWRVRRCVGLPLAAARFKLGRLSNDAVKSRFLLAIVGGLGREEVERDAEQFVARHFPAMLKPQAARRIAWHRQQGHRLVLASASLDLYAVCVATRLGFDSCLCTRTAAVERRLTGALDGPNLRGTAKLAAVERLLPRGCELYVYSDHHDDLPLLMVADHPIAVDPTRRLAAESQRRGFAMESWGGTWSAGRTILQMLRWRTRAKTDSVPEQS